MVQRKVLSKLGIQADQIKSEKLSANFRPSSHHHQDGKPRGADLKKKMKKSRSTKLSNFEGLRSSPSSLSSPFRKEIPQPGRPPPPLLPGDASTPAAKPRRLSQGKNNGVVPNYMKSTSSADAKKECSQVTSQSSPAGSNFKSSPRRSSSSSKLSPASGSTSSKNLKRSSSLKLVRTLTKTPSFKPARASAKRCSKVVLCADVDAQRATCSSTLKETKFPNYLMLNPGGTEAEGTSVMKVCPYTYCSLNCHRHAQLPPLKCFLSARRRLMKTQKNAKVVPLSPSQGGLDHKPGNEKSDAGLDFFVEIYAQSKDEDLPATRRVDVKEEIVEFAVESEDDSACCENDFKGHLEEDFEGINEKVKGTYSICEENLECLDSGSEDSVMEQDDEREYAAFELDEAAVYSTEEDNRSCSDIEYVSETEDTTLHEESAGWHEHTGDFQKVIFNDEELKKEDDLSLELQMPGVEHEVDGTVRVQEGPESRHVFDYLSYNYNSSTEDEFEEMETPNDSRMESSTEVFTAEAKTSILKMEGNDISEADDADSNVLLQSVVDESRHSDMNGDGASYDQQNEVASSNDIAISFASQILTQGDLLNEETQVHQDLNTEPCSLEEESIKQDVGERMEETEDDGCVESATKILIFGQSSENSGKVNEGTPTIEVNPYAKQEDSRNKYSYLDDNSVGESDAMGMKESAEPESAKSDLEVDAFIKTKSTRKHSRSKGNPDEEPFDPVKNFRCKIRCKRPSDAADNLRGFNPKEPNYLPEVPDPEAERVDLRHQMVDERKNSEEWMLDYALRQTVSKLAPARKKKVALLVEAFEKVLPVSKDETHFQSSSSDISHARPIQACS